MTQGVNIEIEEDTDYSCQFTWLNPSTNLPISLVGYTAFMKARVNHEDTTAVLDLSSAGGTIVLGGTAGTVTVNIASTLTKNVLWTRAFYDLYVVSGAGVKYKIAKGFVVIMDGVTNV